MEGKMKHLMVNLAILGAMAGGQAMAQRSEFPRVRELVAQSQPLTPEPPVPVADPAYTPGVTANPTPPHGVPNAGQAGGVAPNTVAPADMPRPGYAPGISMSDPIPPGTPEATNVPTDSSTAQWQQYERPDYEDGLTSVSPCCETCGRGINCPDVWYAQQRVTAWARSKYRGIPISGTGAFVNVTDANGVTTSVFQADTVYGTRSIAFDVAAGYGATLRRYWRQIAENKDVYIQASYFGMNDWRERRTATNTDRLFTNFTDGGQLRTAGYGNLFTPFTDTDVGPTSGVGGFDRVDTHEVYFESRIHSVDLGIKVVPRARPDRIVLHPNGRWRRECQPGIYNSLSFGIRYFSLNEQFNLTGTGTMDIFDTNTGTLLGTANTRGTYDISTYNDMLGFQLGVDLKYRRCLWQWGAEARIAPCINFSSQTSRIVTSAAGDPFAGADLNEFRYASRDDVALVGDVSLVGYYQVHPRITLRASWDMLWAVGVALAPEQLDFRVDPPMRINTNGLVFYQGISLGMVWSR